MSRVFKVHKFLASAVKVSLTYFAFWVVTLAISVILVSGVSVFNPAEFWATAKRIFWLCETAGKLAGDQKRFEEFLGHWRLHNGAVPEGAPFAEDPAYLRDISVPNQQLKAKLSSPFADVYE